MWDSNHVSSVSRRDFLKLGGLLTVSLLAQGIPGWAAKSLAPVTASPKLTQRKLIVIFLRGAADGLNILVPYGDNNYYRMRPKIAIPKPGLDSGVMPLDNYFGLNPNLEALLPYWQSKQLAFIVNSGSTDSTRSHFDAQDYMESGTPGVKKTDTGWLNRFLALSPNMTSPTRAINMGPTLPRILQGSVSVANVSTQAKASRYAALDRPAVSSAFEALYQNSQDELGRNFKAGMEARESIKVSLAEEMVAANRGAPVASQFTIVGKRIAQLLKNDPTVQVVFSALGGWDTHVNQGSSQGALGRQLKGLGDGLAGMMDGLKASGQLDSTMVVVMSEFGRTAQENGNAGTDHGHGNVMWVLGGGVQGGQVAGVWKGLTANALTEGRDMPVTTDFRSVLSDLLVIRYGLNPSQLQQVFPGWQYRQMQQSVFKA